MKHGVVFLIASLFFTTAVPLRSEPAPRPITTQMVNHIDSAVKTALVRQHVAAISLAIVENGEVVYANGYGVREIASGAKADAQTIYPIGSNTKQFTAAAILLLQQQGHLNVQDPVAKYLPEAPHAGEITIEELLEQVSGLPDYTQTPQYAKDSSREVTPEQMLAAIRNAPFAFKPGTNWQYSNTNYLLLSMVIAKASGESYQAFVLNNLLKRHDLSTAAFDTYARSYPDEARGYTAFAMGALHDAPHSAYSWFQGAGDLMMSASDLARWDIALDSGSVVSPASFAKMSTAKRLPNGTSTGYGYGLSAGNRFLGHAIVGHLGGFPGFISEDLTIPSDHVAVVLLGNSDTFNPVPIAHDIVATIYGQSLAHDPPKALPETSAEASQARIWLERALAGKINSTNATPEFTQWLMPTQTAQASVETDLRKLGNRLGAPVVMRLVSREGPPGVHAFDYHVTFANDVIDFQYALRPSGKIDYLNFAPVYDY